MKLYDIRYYKSSDRPRLVSFLDKYWRRNHIIATSDMIFDFQHKFGERYTFVVAENQETKEFDGVYGYIITHKYDTSDIIPNVAWGAIWKVRDDIQNAEIGSLGLGMLKFILKNEDIVTFASSGISATHKKIAEGLGFMMGKMTHYYIANNSIEDYQIAYNPQKLLCPKNSVQLVWMNWKDVYRSDIYNSINPYKNLCYCKNRYECHPVYIYNPLGLYHNGRLVLLFIIREQRINNASCLRIVDILGDNVGLDNINQAMQRILEEMGTEYIDCWNYGLPQSFFDRLGFCKVTGETIIPDYFAPFEKRNVNIEIDSLENEPLIIFKGDSDQDRPNSIVK